MPNILDSIAFASLDNGSRFGNGDSGVGDCGSGVLRSNNIASFPLSLLELWSSASFEVFKSIKPSSVAMVCRDVVVAVEDSNEVVVVVLVEVVVVAIVVVVVVVKPSESSLKSIVL